MLLNNEAVTIITYKEIILLYQICWKKEVISAIIDKVVLQMWEI